MVLETIVLGTAPPQKSFTLSVGSAIMFRKVNPGPRTMQNRRLETFTPARLAVGLSILLCTTTAAVRLRTPDMSRPVEYADPRRHLPGVAQGEIYAASTHGPQVAGSSTRMLTCSSLRDSQVFSGFGWRKGPTDYYGRFHTGIDLRGYSGQPVVSADRGVITGIVANGTDNYLVEVRHESDVKTVYSHLAKIAPDVRLGRLVSAGEMLGNLQRSHRTRLPHLHFEVLLRGRFVDPLTFGYARAAC
jgi:murein DD-endopeptidase MepM/ murein hydrolase activator NlpD